MLGALTSSVRRAWSGGSGASDAHLSVGGEHGRRGAQLGAHVRDHVPVHRGQRAQAGAVIFE